MQSDANTAPQTSLSEAVPAPSTAKREAFRTSDAGLFSMHDHSRKLAKLGDPLAVLRDLIDWEIFRPDLMRLYDKPDRKAVGRKPIDPVLMFKILLLQRLYNLSDDQAEFQILDRTSFQRFLGIFPEYGAPDAKTIWKFRDRLTELGILRDLFLRFDAYLGEKGFTAKGGQIVDATFVQAPRQRNTREENAVIVAGEVPEEWKSAPKKLAQKDLDARWTKKGGVTFYGYKNHVLTDVEHKLIRAAITTDAAIHDSQMLGELLDDSVCERPVYADSAYRSDACERRLAAAGVESRIHERPYAGKPLTDAQKAANREKSRVRVRVEHIFGFMKTSMNGASFIRCIGSRRAQVTITLTNLMYNIARYGQLTLAGRTV